MAAVGFLHEPTLLVSLTAAFLAAVLFVSKRHRFAAVGLAIVALLGGAISYIVEAV